VAGDGYTGNHIGGTWNGSIRWGKDATIEMLLEVDQGKLTVKNVTNDSSVVCTFPDVEQLRKMDL